MRIHCQHLRAWHSKLNAHLVNHDHLKTHDLTKLNVHVPSADANSTQMDFPVGVNA